MNAKILNVTLDQYHADEVGCSVPTLNSHIAHELVTKSPLHAQLSHPKMGGQSKEASKAMDKGTLIHACLLHAGRAPVRIIQAENYRTKKAQEERDQARLEGELPLLEKDADSILQAAMILERKLREDHGIVFDGKSEVPILWKQNDVWCRRCIDHLKPLTAYELKSTASASPEFCQRQSFNLGYDIQMAATLHALAALEPENIGAHVFKFIFVELEPPYDVYVPPYITGQFSSFANSRWQRALMIWKHCLRNSSWPGYESIPLDIADYLATKELEGV